MSVSAAVPKPTYPWYQSVHKVQAVKIIGVTLESDAPALGVILEYRDGFKTLQIKVSVEYFKKHAPKPGGYYVRYEDGYESYCPAAAFEKNHKKL